VKKEPWRATIEQAVWNKTTKQSIRNFLERIFTIDLVNQLDAGTQIEMARTFYHLCQLDANLDKDNAKQRFCSLFAQIDEIEPFNWEEDAKNYFIRGPAGVDNGISQAIACLLLADFIATTDLASKALDTAPIANLRFAHAETIMPFLVHLGLYRKDSIDDLLRRKEQRTFRTSVMSPMAANVQWVLYECPDQQYRVRMRHNEQDIAFPIPECNNRSTCEWEIVKGYYERDKRTCDETTWETQICQGVSCAATGMDNA
jgi:hypothetical protein